MTLPLYTFYIPLHRYDSLSEDMELLRQKCKGLLAAERDDFSRQLNDLKVRLISIFILFLPPFLPSFLPSFTHPRSHRLLLPTFPSCLFSLPLSLPYLTNSNPPLFIIYPVTVG